jgi:hypothetical protein
LGGERRFSILDKLARFIRDSPDMKPNIPPVLITIAFACFALSPAARAVDPPPDGGYPNQNTAEGEDALFSLTDGTDNTATGFDALYFNTTGNFNTANGALALYSNSTGLFNTATGASALYSNTSGGGNTAIGDHALFSNTNGGPNTAIGWQALYSTTSSGFNTAIGIQALYSNTNGGNNTAIGDLALKSNTTAAGNTAIGEAALFANTTGFTNTATGAGALENNTTGSNNIAVGVAAGLHLTHGNNNIDIGSDVRGGGEFRTIRIGTTPTHERTFIAGISGVTVAGGVGVIVDTNGQLGTVVSSERFKDGIKPMDNASEAILALKPVTFRYKKELDPEGVPEFGLVAEDVEKVNPALVARGADGKAFTVRYEAVNAMLLNEFLKEHKKVEKQEATITRLTNDFRTVSTQQRNEIQLLSAQLKEQAEQIQKVGAQLEASRPAPQVVNNP